MKIIMEFPDNQLRGFKEGHLEGLLVSFYSLLDDILLQRCKLRNLEFFFRDRISKREKLILQSAFEKFILSYGKKENNSLNESSEKTNVLDPVELPESFRQLLRFFEDTVVSIPATESHQASKAKATTNKKGGE